MNMETEDKLFQEIKEINQSIGKISTDLEVIKSQEKPAPNCREKMELNTKDINKLGSKVDKKIGWFVFLTISSFLFAFASGAYVYTWNESKDINKRIEGR